MKKLLDAVIFFLCCALFGIVAGAVYASADDHVIYSSNSH